MFGRRRGNFEEQSPVPGGMTKYDEKYIFSTDGGFGSSANVGNNAFDGGNTNNFGAAVPQTETTATVMSMRDIPPTPAQTATEKPMVFKLRANNDVYVYEFSDRLEYYLKTDTCMLALGARAK